jgi:hypothetical protein
MNSIAFGSLAPQNGASDGHSGDTPATPVYFVDVSVRAAEVEGLDTSN